VSFRSERELLNTALASPSFDAALATDFGWHRFLEPKGLFGVPDLVLTSISCENGSWLCSETMAVEAKLRNWQKALKQAFRYRSFAHVSYVLLDRSYARAAVRNLDRFVRANVGLMTITPAGDVEIYHQAHRADPYCNQTTERFRLMVLHTIDTDC
jgi:hypothetical protein